MIAAATVLRVVSSRSAVTMRVGPKSSDGRGGRLRAEPPAERQVEMVDLGAEAGPARRFEHGGDRPASGRENGPSSSARSPASRPRQRARRRTGRRTAPNRRAEPTSRSRRRPRGGLPRPGWRMPYRLAEEHDAEPGQHDVELRRRWRPLDASTCNHSTGARALGDRCRRRGLQHRGVRCRARDRAAVADRGCRPPGRGPRAATDVEHRFAGRQPCGDEQLVGHRCELCLEHLRLLHPARPGHRPTLPAVARPCCRRRERVGFGSVATRSTTPMGRRRPRPGRVLQYGAPHDSTSRR